MPFQLPLCMYDATVVGMACNFDSLKNAEKVGYAQKHHLHTMHAPIRWTLFILTWTQHAVLLVQALSVGPAGMALWYTLSALQGHFKWGSSCTAAWALGPLDCCGRQPNQSLRVEGLHKC